MLPGRASISISRAGGKGAAHQGKILIYQQLVEGLKDVSVCLCEGVRSGRPGGCSHLCGWGARQGKIFAYRQRVGGLKDVSVCVCVYQVCV